MLEAGRELEHAAATGRRLFVQVVNGDVKINGQVLSAGDGAAIENETGLAIDAITETEFLLFDMA